MMGMQLPKHSDWQRCPSVAAATPNSGQRRRVVPERKRNGEMSRKRSKKERNKTGDMLVS